MGIYKKIDSKTGIMILFAISLLKEFFLDGALVFIPVTDSVGIFSRIIDVVIYLGALVYICREKYSKKEIVIIIAGSLLMLIVSLNSGEMGLLPFWLWMILVKQVEYDKWIKTSLCCNCIGMLAGTVATFTGVHKDVETLSRSVLGTRYTLGMQWPNLTGQILFSIVAGYSWLKKEKLRKKDYIMLIAITVIVFIFMNSLGTTIVLLTFIFAIFLFQNIFQDRKLKKRGLYILFFLAIGFAVLSIILGVINVAEIPLLAKADRFISNRYRDVYRTFAALGFSLFGQAFNFQELNAYAMLNGEGKYYMDCMWMSLPVHYGIVFSVIFIYVYFSSMYKFVKKEETMTVIIFFCGALYAMEQQVWPFLFAWIFMVFLAEVLFRNDSYDENFSEKQKKMMRGR